MGGAVQDTPTSTSVRSTGSSSGHGSVRVFTGLSVSPVALSQRSRATRASASAAGPSTAIITSWKGG